ncbi:hypothetical protein CHARACLAT_027600 [Characodon lateralis]|uniref:Uncharacterized protein n=1 Tax=Characodon lateralis TaxID=208331 RepID=A0ABU7D171_9TELE|nr:hypothetical protein [Characodon lateralis]
MLCGGKQTLHINLNTLSSCSGIMGAHIILWDVFFSKHRQTGQNFWEDGWSYIQDNPGKKKKKKKKPLQDVGLETDSDSEWGRCSPSSNSSKHRAARHIIEWLKSRVYVVELQRSIG